MKLIRGIHNLSSAPRGCVLTIGNFDGVHRGHQALLQGLRKEGEARGLPVVVMIFEPQPLELFAGINRPPVSLACVRSCATWQSPAWTTCCACVSIVALPH